MASFRLFIVLPDEGASVVLDPVPISGLYASGTMIDIDLTVISGYTFEGWYIKGVLESAVQDFTYTMPESDVYLVAQVNGVFVPTTTYGILYEAEYCTKGTLETTRVEVLQKDYVGLSIEKGINNVTYRFGTNNSNIRDIIIGSSLDFDFPVETLDEFSGLLSLDNREFQVKYYRNYVDSVTYDFIWTGYLITTVLTEPDQAPPYMISLTATDGLKVMEQLINTTRILDYTAAPLLLSMLNQTFITGLPLKEAVDIFETRMDNTGSLFDQFTINQQRLYKNDNLTFTNDDGVQANPSITLKKGIERLLSPWVCRIFQWNGYWQIMRLNELFKTSIKYNEFDIDGLLIGSETVDNTTQELDCLRFANIMNNGEIGFTEFTASLHLGDINTPALNEILVEPFEGDSWRNFGGDVYLLKRWRYEKATYFDGVRDSDICRIEYVSDPDSGDGGKFARFWGTANGISDGNLSYIEFNSDSRITGVDIAVEGANTISIGAKFRLIRKSRNDAVIPTPGTHIIGLSLEINGNYLYETSTANVYDWDTVVNIVQFPAVNSGEFNTIKITNVPVPEDGIINFKLYQLITVTGDRHRYSLDWDDAFVQIEKNDGLVNEEIIGKGFTDVNYPSIADTYDTYIGDAITKLSSSAIRLSDVVNTPVSETWSRDGIEELELLRIVIQDLVNLEGKNNFRVTGTYHGNIVPFQAAIYNSKNYLVNSFILNDWDNSFSLDLYELI